MPGIKQVVAVPYSGTKIAAGVTKLTILNIHTWWIMMVQTQRFGLVWFGLTSRKPHLSLLTENIHRNVTHSQTHCGYCVSMMRQHTGILEEPQLVLFTAVFVVITVAIQSNNTTVSD